MSRPATSPSGPGGTWEPPAPEELDQLLEGYRIDSHIATGGMAAVYRGVQTSMDRSVAVKVMPAGAGAEYAYAARFEREAKAMAQLTHPNIVTVYDFGKAGHFLYLVMEFVEGTDLHQMRKARTLDPNKVPTYLAKICDALEYAHGFGIIHRDIKPANIIVRPDGNIKVADFGLAKIQDPALAQMTVTGYAMGTPDYVAPESLIAGVEVDHRADIFSLGVLAYELITGDVPRGAFEPPSKRNPAVDRRLDAVIKKAMQRDPDSRFQSVAEMRDALKRALSGPKLITGNTGRVMPNKANTGRVVPVQSVKSPASAAPAHVIPIPEPKSGGGAWKIPLAALGGAAVVVIGAYIAFSGPKNDPAGNPGGGKEKPNTVLTPDKTGTDIWEPTKKPDPDTKPDTGGEKNPTVPVTTPAENPAKPSASFAHVTFPLPLPKRPIIAGSLVHFPFLSEPETPDKNVSFIPEFDDVVQIAVPTTDATESDGFLYYPGTLLVLHADGTVTAHGRNNVGQAKVPASLKDVVQVASGQDTSFALLSDGTVRAWGSDADGQLKIPDSVQKNAVRIAGGDSHATALLRDGSVVTWGKQEPDTSGFVGGVGLSASFDRSVALAADGKLHNWGGKWGFDTTTISEPIREFILSGRGAVITDSGKWFRFDRFAADTVEQDPRSAPYARLLFVSVRNREIPGIHYFALTQKDEIIHAGDPGSIHPAFKSEASNCIDLVPWRTHTIGIRILDPTLRAKAIAERDAIRLHRTDSLLATNHPETPPPSSPETPTVTETPASGPDPEIAAGRLAQLVDAYQTAVADRVEKPRADALATLRTLYAGGLKRAEDAVATAGDLDAVLAIQNEAKAIAAGEIIPDTDPEGTPAALTQLRDTYRAERTKIDAQRAAAATPLRQQLESALTVLETDLTKDKDIPGALAVRDYKSNLADPPAPPETPATEEPAEEVLAVVEEAANPGHLQSLGVFFKGKTRDTGEIDLDLSDHKEIADFVQVAVAESSWAARRANGDVVGCRRVNGGVVNKIHASNIRNIFNSTNNDHIFGITLDGVLGKITDKGFEPEKWIEGKGRVTQWGNGHGHQIALTEDGNAHVMGGVYGPQHDKPFAARPAEALTDIAHVAGTRYGAATITNQGDIYCWGTSGVSRGSTDAIRGTIVRFYSRADNYAALTDRGDFYWIRRKDGTEVDIIPVAMPGRVTHVACVSYAPPIYRSAGRWRSMGDGSKPIRAEFFEPLMRKLSGDTTEVSFWFGDNGRFAVWIDPVKP